MRSRTARGQALRAAVPLLLVLATTSGCGFANALAHPDAQTGAAATAAPTTVVPAAGTPAAAAPAVIVDGELTTTAGLDAGHVTVTTGPVRTGLVPPVPNIHDCGLDAPALQYVPVDVAFSTPGLAAHVAIGRGPATPADVAEVGIFVESHDGEETYCDDSPPLPTQDRFFNQGGAAAITAYVLLDQAVTAASPGGRGEVFPTLQLRISDLRLLDAPGRGRALGVGTLSVGTACADDPDAICVPLG